eukprot:m.22716 g.22716  ORF g.22716 m.22716 type:complete len:852 (+) comp5851_c0_seq1:51-2606(+)
MQGSWIITTLALLTAVRDACPSQDKAGWNGGTVGVTNCSVVIAGGSTAALAAAIASAKEGVRTCLLEPTDWPGGQMTSAGVPAIDFNNANDLVDPDGNHVNVSFASHYPGNHAPEFFELLNSINSTGRCSVSSNCFPPQAMVQSIKRLLAKPEIANNLDVYLLTVPVNASGTLDGHVSSAQFVQRRVVGAACGGWDIPLSEGLPDYYSPTPSQRWDKRILDFRGAAGARMPTFIDATEWGELLALLDAPYLQGLSEKFDGDSSGQGGNDQCGQSFSVTLTATLHDQPQEETDHFPPMPQPEYTANCDTNASCSFIWERRRLISTNPTGAIASGDMTLFVVQDWRWSYPYKTRAAAKVEAETGWMGGLNMSVLQSAETEAFGWYAWFKAHAQFGSRLTLRDTSTNTSSSPVGTCTGLMKMPYIRGSRRSVGIGGFVLNATTMSWNKSSPLPTAPVGTPFPDRVAIASFFFDVHEMYDYQPEGRKCYPTYVPSFIAYYNDDNVKPFSVPLRALTNAKYDQNFLLAGKTIASSFLVSSAVRLHPGEWATGSAAGAVAATLFKTATGVASVLGDPQKLAHVIDVAKKHTPRDWLLQCPWGTDAPSQGNGWKCFQPPTPKPPPPTPGNVGFSCKGPVGHYRCVQSLAQSGPKPALNSTCNNKCQPLNASEWLASIPMNWAVKRNTPIPPAPPGPTRSNCSSWPVTQRGWVLHGNDTGSVTPPSKNMSSSDLMAFCIQSCCNAGPTCAAWVTGPADSNGPTWNYGDPRCFLKSEKAVLSQRWPMLNYTYTAYGIAPPSSPTPYPGSATLTALRDTVLKKSELFSGNLPPSQLKAVHKGAIWIGTEQIDDNYWLVHQQ